MVSLFDDIVSGLLGSFCSVYKGCKTALYCFVFEHVKMSMSMCVVQLAVIMFHTLMIFRLSKCCSSDTCPLTWLISHIAIVCFHYYNGCAISVLLLLF